MKMKQWMCGCSLRPTAIVGGKMVRFHMPVAAEITCIGLLRRREGIPTLLIHFCVLGEA